MMSGSPCSRPPFSVNPQGEPPFSWTWIWLNETSCSTVSILDLFYRYYPRRNRPRGVTFLPAQFKNSESPSRVYHRNGQRNECERGGGRAQKKSLASVPKLLWRVGRSYFPVPLFESEFDWLLSQPVTVEIELWLSNESSRRDGRVRRQPLCCIALSVWKDTTLEK